MTTRSRGLSSKAAEVPVSECSPRDRRAFLRTCAVALAPSVFPRALYQRPSAASKVTQALEADMPGLLKQFGVPGLSMAVVENGAIARAAGFGVRKAGEPDPVTADTIFEAASLSKPPFAYLTLQLAELGRIDLDAGIGSFFRQPDFANEPSVDAITPRIVLSHRTGLMNWRPAQQPMKLLFPPGSQFGYSGEAYVRLQRFIEKATGTGLEPLLRTYALAPSRMEQSSYVWRPEYARVAAEGHNASGAPVRTRLWGFDAAAPPAMKLPPGVEGPPMFAIPNAAASLYTSANEYARFLSMLLVPPPADAVHLGARSLDAMFTPASHVNDEITWGLGWGLARVGGADSFWHWGNNGVYQGFVAGSRTRRWGAVVFTNSANGLKLCREVFGRLLGADHPAFRWSQVLR
jgi:CubicO group peptidase (beta-lactamase class C family)